MKSSTYIIIQARTGSTRFANKMLLPFFDGKTILQLVIEKLIDEFGKEKIILATTENKNDNELESLANKYDIKCFRGDEKDVLFRFIKCAEKFGAENVVRVCADNPFLDMELLKKLISEAEGSKSEYVSYYVTDKPAIKTHYGFFAEFVKLDALIRVDQKTKDEFYREHVTNYIYSNPNFFRIKWIPAPAEISENKGIRLTVDTEQDFKTCSEIYRGIVSKTNFGYRDIIDHVSSNPEIKSKMIYQIVQNEK